jgi:Protein of unknown function (DUF1566)
METTMLHHRSFWWALVLGAVLLVALPRAAARGVLNDTGATLCRTPEGVDTADCAGTGQDGEFGRDATRPQPRDGRAGFSYRKVAADGSPLPANASEWACVQDRLTGLTWEVKTDDGRLRDQNSTYTNFGDGRAFDASAFAAAVNALGLCGAGDWRLPTHLELHGLVDYAHAPPLRSIVADWFPYTRAGAYWTSTAVADDTADPADNTDAWAVNFARGDLYGGGPRGGRLAVRLVRGPALPAPRLIGHHGVVLDKTTRLVWQRCSEGQAWSGGTCQGSAGAYTLDQGIARAQARAVATGFAWRLPNAKELASLIDTTRDRPAIDPQAFPATPQARYWTATPLAGRPLDFWVVNFGFGAVDSRERASEQAVRLVRDAD